MTFYRWGNKDLYQKIVDQEKYVRDQQARVKAIQEIEHIIQDEAAITPLLITTGVSFAKPVIRNFLPTWNSYVGYYWATEMWRTDA